MTDPGATIVVGLGNPLMGDDGLGLAALAVLREAWTLEPAVELVDGGTWGMNLLPLIEDAGRLLFLDAIRAGAAPGTLVVRERRELPRSLGIKLSPHQVDLREVLALAELRRTLPDDTVALGLEPHTVELGTELSAPVRHALPALVSAAVERLAQWGIRARPAAACTS